MWNSIEQAIAEATGNPFQIVDRSTVSGGCINDAQRLDGADSSFFVKTNDPSFLPLFEAEAEALREIAQTKTIRVPEPICHGMAGSDRSFLALEFVQTGPESAASQRELGESLARLHKTKKEFFGWKRDNAIGSTHQPNDRGDDWATFYRDHRLGFQFDLAARKGKSFQGAEELLERVPELLAGHEVFPSILHGDLWGGNASTDSKGMPFVFDPATYYGDRETDLAFTEMFGGFSTDFGKAYENTFPLDVGYPRRKILYNLYHLLNHFNIFGGGYASSAQASMEELLH
ncbi:MAG: fructosamine kinase family protein [Opitutae bacterium]|nr:fructosamine kinase family protein [Opitutae bacterium]